MHTTRTGAIRKFTARKWVVSAAFAALTLSACGGNTGEDESDDTTVTAPETEGTDSETDDTDADNADGADAESGDSDNSDTAASDACEVDPAVAAQFADADEPSDFELDDLRNEVYADMACLTDEVESVKLEDLSTHMYTPDSGFTWYPETEELANHGFAVSVGGGQLVENIRDLSPNEIEEILIEYVDTYKDSDEWVTGKSAIGGWQNPDTGDVALNISIVEDDIHVAREIAEENDQLAIFDLQLLTSVWTDGVTP